ncbi:AraC family transcriptional regulator [Lentisphaera marina]|uniref:helix-turn-helix domain-containing protein n=1 Tax=Lentisphaera marina TaxID=1111041 RepID=UPI0023656DC0|nr:AraC family transcriptional regulator [Lentisphaera marina]MDD7986554.1 AraC family transcriptional regulator [Lentisphaera marina]
MKHKNTEPFFVRRLYRQEFTGENSLPKLRCGIRIREIGQEVAETSEYIIMYMIDGSGVYQTSCGQEIPFESGDIVQRFPAQRHKISWNEQARMAVLVVPHQVFDLLKTVSQSPVLSDPILKNYGDGERFIATCLKIKKMMMEYSDDKLLEISNEMQAFISRIIMNAEQSDPLISKVDAYLDEHQSAKIKLEDIANYCAMSVSSFRFKFTEITHTSPGRYIINKRLERARELLLNSKRSVLEISAELSYPDVSDFCRQFKKFIGVTPLQYRAFPDC